MRERAYVLIQTEVGKTKKVAAAIRKSEGVVSVDMMTGPYDIISVVEGETLADIGALLTEQVHTIKGISRTVTCLVVKIP